MAASLKERKDYTMAMRMCDKALELKSDHFKIFYRVGTIYYAKGDLHNAL